MPLLAAAGEGKLDIVQILLAAGAEIETGGEHGTTALSIAAREGHQQVVEYLLTNGAQADKPNQEGWTPFHFCYRPGPNSYYQTVNGSRREI
jgi:ankyrin repeat/SOCS box protein 2